MDGDDRYAVQVAQRPRRATLLGDGIGPDHDLDSVVPEPGPVAKAVAALPG